MHIALDIEYTLPDIVGGCRLGHPGWQKVMYEQYYSYALSICIRYTSNYEEAKEVLNDGFVKVFKNISNFTEPENNDHLSKLFMGWLKKIMINTGINYSVSAHKRTELPVAGDNLPEDSKWENPVSNLAYEDLVKLIQRLTPSYRNVFNLYVIEGYKHEEISNMLGISTGASKSNLLKARKSLRKMLEKIYEEEV
ncbi:MAG: RNA polymerase sigma factor [Niabella sp.]